MRRKLPKELAEHQGVYDLSPSGAGEPLLDVTIGLECITPVIGGGVRAREPDTVDLVRVPGIRGQLRFWWRAFGNEQDTATLFAKEIGIWGGVSGGANGAAVASRVRISIERIDHKGELFPAGVHEQKKGGPGLSPMPDWNRRCKELSYGMFPLQRNKSELDNAVRERKQRLPTSEVRTGLRFTLRLQLHVGAAGPLAGDHTNEEERVLWALWAWIHFGGIGGRTTRGFGALAPTSSTGLPPGWAQQFTPPKPSDAATWLQSSWQQGPMRYTTLPATAGWTHFGGSQLVAGTEMAEGKAHSLLLRKLREFRQGVPMGRVESTRGKPAGRSNWPEPDMLRAYAESTKRDIRWDHTPSRIMRDLISPTQTSTQWRPPRAGFGLPIVMKFIGNDRSADAAIELDRPGGRWMSPLRLRPIACSDGKHIPVMLLFAMRPWSCASDSITVNGNPVYLKEGKAQPGPVGPIGSRMTRGSRDAARAFFEWLSVDETFRGRP